MESSVRIDAKGILNPQLAERKFQITRHLPSQDLGFFVEWYWIIHWDLRDQPPHSQDVLPYPSVNLAIEQNKSGIFGVETGKFTRQLIGQGRVVAAKFRPGGFYPFVQLPVSQFTDKVFALGDIFGSEGDKLEQSVLTEMHDHLALELMDHFLCERMPNHDRNVTIVNEIIICIINDRSITRVDELVKRISFNKRTLQRLFNQYVGVSPKWVIQRYRLQDAADQLLKNQATDCTELALRLGYFDLAHFIKDFKNIVGCSPTEYAELARNTS